MLLTWVVSGLCPRQGFFTYVNMPEIFSRASRQDLPWASDERQPRARAGGQLARPSAVLRDVE